MIIETLSTFPAMYDSVMGTSMMRIAQEKGILRFTAHDLRDWTHDRHRTTDDGPYGGGAGLVMKCEPLFEAYESIAGNLKQTESPLCPEQDDNPPCHPERSECSPCHPERSEAESRDPVWRASAGAATADAARDPSTARLRRSARDDNQDAAGWRSARDDNREEPAPVPYTIFLAPHGERFDDAVACELAREERLLFVCGHYEGIDERAYALADRVLSLGDYVLTSGELASMVVIDAVVRKLPGVLGAPDGALDESFAGGLLEYPQYTRPAVFRGMAVPDVLLSGDHGAVARWRRQMSLERTARLRPDLLEGAPLSADDREFLKTLPLASDV